MIVYLDASAGAKLFLDEAESEGLASFLDSLSDDDVVLSATLLETELRRAAVRENADQESVTRVLQSVELISMPRSLFRVAGAWPHPDLRSLDALHLAAAARAEVDAIVTYDRRLQHAAAQVGIEVLAPG